MSKIKITQRRSVIGRSQTQRRTMRALGLRKIGSTVEHSDSPTVRGMIFKVRHLIEISEDAPIGTPSDREKS
jgi:large subunit ribosomal protein L30